MNDEKETPQSRVQNNYADTCRNWFYRLLYFRDCS